MNKMTLILARVMVVGTAVSAALMAVGLIWFLTVHAGGKPGDHVFSGEPRYFRDPWDMVVRALDFPSPGERLSLTMIGVFLLLVSPLVRVILAGVGYLWEGNRLYAGISLVVAMVLLISFFW